MCQEWNDTYTFGMLFQWAITIKSQLSMLIESIPMSLK